MCVRVSECITWFTLFAASVILQVMAFVALGMYTLQKELPRGHFIKKYMSISHQKHPIMSNIVQLLLTNGTCLMQSFCSLSLKSTCDPLCDRCD